jgi:hypothetical protein
MSEAVATAATSEPEKAPDSGVKKERPVAMPSGTSPILLQKLIPLLKKGIPSDKATEMVFEEIRGKTLEDVEAEEFQKEDEANQHAEWVQEMSTRFVYAIAHSMGVDTSNLTLREVVDVAALSEKRVASLDNWASRVEQWTKRLGV